MLKMKRFSDASGMAIVNVLSTGLVSLIQFGSIPFFTRALGTESFGLVSVYTAWVQIVAVVIGLRVDGTIGSAYANISEEEQDSYQYSLVMLVALCGGIAFTLFYFFGEHFARVFGLEESVAALLLCHSVATCLISLLTMRFVFSKKPLCNLALTVGMAAVSTVVSVWLCLGPFHGPRAYFGRVLGLAGSSSLVALIVTGAVFTRRRSEFSLKYWLFAVPLGLPLIFHALSQLVLAQTGKIFLQRTGSNKEVGIFALALMVVSLLGSVYNALNNAFVPIMYDDLAGKSNEADKRKHFVNYVHLFTGCTIMFVCLAPEVLKFMGPPEYWAGQQLLPMLIMGQYCIFLYSFPVNYEFYRMKTSIVSLGTILAAAVNLFLVLWLVPVWGAKGAAIGSGLAYEALFLFHFLFARYVLKDRNYPVLILFLGQVVVCLSIILIGVSSQSELLRFIMFSMTAFVVCRRIVGNRTIF